MLKDKRLGFQALTELAKALLLPGAHINAKCPGGWTALQVELGITLAPAHQGRGLATEALKSVLDYVFGRFGKHRVSAVTDVKNSASACMLRRVGFRQEAHHIENVWFKGAWGSEFVFALLAQEWQEYTNQSNF